MNKNIINDKIKDLAILADDCYTPYDDINENNNSIKLSHKNQKTSIVTVKDNLNNGFHAKVYKNNSNEIVIAYAGTDSLKDFTNSDVPMFLGKNPDQLVDAIKLYEDVRKENPNSNGEIIGCEIAMRIQQY